MRPLVQPGRAASLRLSENPGDSGDEPCRKPRLIGAPATTGTSHVFAGLEEKRIGVPDEARYRFELVLDGRKAESVTLWEGQLEESGRGRSLLQTLRRFVANVSERTAVL